MITWPDPHSRAHSPFLSRSPVECIDELQDAADGLQTALDELRREATPDKCELLALRLRAMADRAARLSTVLA